MADNTILLVEDSADDRELIARMLRKHGIPGKVVMSRDGVDALDYLFRAGVHVGRVIADDPAVVLLDLKMPRLGGFDVLKRIRQDQRTQITPVVVLTSSSQDEDMVRSYSLGANSYVRKPVSFDQFSDAIKQLGTYWLLQNQMPKPCARPLCDLTG